MNKTKARNWTVGARESRRLSLLLGIVALLAAGGAVWAQGEEMYDTDRALYLQDTDGDTYPDLTERLEGTSPRDAEDFPGRAPESVTAMASGFPTTLCRPGFRQAGSRLCISDTVQDAQTLANASVLCRDQRAYVCGYEELRYLYIRTGLDATFNPEGRWIGQWVADNEGLCGNRSITFDNDPDIGDFEGTCSRFDSRAYWCCHDDE